MNKKVVFLTLILIMMFMSLTCYAANEQITATLSKKISIIYNDEIKEFYDVNGTKVNPILYQGTTYLPVRAISSLFGISVKWDGEANKIYLNNGGDVDSNTCKTTSVFIAGDNETVQPYLNKVISIEYKEKIQTFEDVNGKTVYPLSYQGTTYLPVRAISNMYGANIEWNAENQQITIERKNEIAEITNVTIKVIDNVLCAVITTKTPLYDYKYYSLTENSNRLVIDLQNSKFGISQSTQEINYDVLKSVRFGNQGNNVSRIVLDVDEINEYSVSQSKDRLTTYFALTKEFEVNEDTTSQKDYTLVASIGNTIYIPEIEKNDDKNSGDNKQDDNKSNIDVDSENSDDNSKPEEDNKNTLTPEGIANLATVTAITYSPSTEKTKIKINGNYEFETSQLENPSRFVLDIKNAKLSVDGPTEIEPKNSNITKIRFAQNDVDIVRVVFDLKEQTEATVKEQTDYLQVSFEEVSDENVIYEVFDDYATLTLKDVKKSVFSISESSKYNRYSLLFSSSKFETEAQTLDSDDKFTKNIQVKSSKIVINGTGTTEFSIKQVDNDVVVTITLETKKSDGKFVLLLDAGHGGSDPGACHGDTEAERHLPENQEKTYTLAIMLKLKELLENEDDIEVRTSRTTDVYIDREGRIDYVLDNDDADMLVSIHINSASQKAYSGTMVLYYNKPNEEEDYGITSKDIATIVRDKLVADTGLLNKGVVSRKDLWILEQNAAGQIDSATGEKRPVTNLPAILCELCFISNDSDHAKLMDEDFQETAANAIFEGILEAKEKAGK